MAILKLSPIELQLTEEDSVTPFVRGILSFISVHLKRRVIITFSDVNSTSARHLRNERAGKRAAGLHVNVTCIFVERYHASRNPIRQNVRYGRSPWLLF